MGIRNFFKKQLNYKDWFDVEGMKQSGLRTKKLCKSFLDSHKGKENAPPRKTFQACVKYYQLTEKDLQQQKRLSLKLVYLYLGCSIGLFLYVFFQLWASHFLAALMTLVLSGFLFLYGLKEYTKVFQIKHRTLKFKLRDCLKELILHRE